MTEKQVFGVIIRGLGVYFSTLGVQQIYSLTILAFSKFANEQSQYNIMDVFSVGLIWFAVSYVLIRKPDLIVDFAYERQSEPDRPPN
jgi:hypothetical protein